MARNTVRTVFDLERDNTLPRGSKGYGDDARFKPLGKRMRAVKEVLCSLPKEQYEKWKSCNDDLQWFIPDQRLWGQVDRFPNKVTIYLSPFLEFVCSNQAIIGLVVHEIAHVLLEHIGTSLSSEDKEREVSEAIREWGFAVEADMADEVLWRFFSQDHHDHLESENAKHD